MKLISNKICVWLQILIIFILIRSTPNPTSNPQSSQKNIYSRKESSFFPVTLASPFSSLSPCSPTIHQPVALHRHYQLHANNVTPQPQDLANNSSTTSTSCVPVLVFMPPTVSDYCRPSPTANTVSVISDAAALFRVILLQQIFFLIKSACAQPLLQCSTVSAADAA